MPVADRVVKQGPLMTQRSLLSRIYWMTGDEKYLRHAIRLGNYVSGDIEWAN